MFGYMWGENEKTENIIFSSITIKYNLEYERFIDNGLMDDVLCPVLLCSALILKLVGS